MGALSNSKRVLIIHSQLDDTVRRRIEQLAASPRLKDYVLGHFFVWTRMSVKFKKLERRLTRKINEFHPDIVIVHGGMAFQTDKKQYVGIMNGVIRRHPSVVFVAQGFLVDRGDFEGKMPYDDDELYRLVGLIE